MSEDLILKKYMQEAIKYPRLSRNEELALAKDIDAKGTKVLWAIYSLDNSFLKDYLVQKEVPPEKLIKWFSEVETVKNKSGIRKAREKFSEISEELKTDYFSSINQGKINHSYLDYLRNNSSVSDPVKMKKLRRELDYNIQNWVNARNQMVNHNLLYAVWVSKKYEYSSKKLSLLDLVQESNKGLCEAVEKYNYRTGYSFINYAQYLVRAKINEVIKNHSRTVRYPSGLNEQLNQFHKTIAILQSKEGNLSREKISKKIGIPLKKVERFFQLSGSEFSLDVEIDELGQTGKDFLINPNSLDDKIIQSDFHKKLKMVFEEIFPSLNSQESDVLRRRFGFNEKQETLAEIGSSYGLSRQRIKQIEEKALQKLRKHPSLKNNRGVY